MSGGQRSPSDKQGHEEKKMTADNLSEWFSSHQGYEALQVKFMKFQDQSHTSNYRLFSGLYDSLQQKEEKVKLNSL
eukprot:2264258-Rhodomonas_salina.3